MAKGPERLTRWVFGPQPKYLSIDHPAVVDIAWAADEAEAARSALDEIRKRVTDLGYDNLDALLEVFQRNIKSLENICSIEHDWRPSTFHEFSTPYWVCTKCSKAEPKTHDEQHDSIRRLSE